MTLLTVLLIFHIQACPAEGTHQTVDEGLFHVLHGASLCLDSMKSMLCSPVLVTHEEEPQLRLLHLQVRRLTAKKHLTWLRCLRLFSVSKLSSSAFLHLWLKNLRRDSDFNDPLSFSEASV